MIDSQGIHIGIDYQNWSHEMIDVLLHDVYELPERRIAAHTIKNGDNVLEIGGGIGVVAVQAALACGHEATHVVFEANKELIPNIMQTLKLNSVAAKVIWGAVVPDDQEDDEVIFNVAEQFWSSSLAGNSKEYKQVRVPAFRIGDVIEEYDADVLIMDVEGAEKDLLANTDLARLKALCVEFHSRYIGREAVNMVVRRLLSSGFNIDFEMSESETLSFKRG
jgi:FkbM family methyltransferase